MNIKMDTLSVEFPDDFEEFRQRANSGGSMYGIFRRRAISSRSNAQIGKDQNGKPQKPALPKPFKRQRSRSLITCSPTLADEKYVLLALFDYAEAKRHQTEIRRHSTAVDGRDLRKVVLTNSLNRSLNMRPPELDSGGGCGGDGLDSNFLRPDSFCTQPGLRKNSATTILVPPTQRKNSISLQVPPTSRKNSIVLAAPPGSRKNSVCVSYYACSHPPAPLNVPMVPVRKYSLPRLVLSGDNGESETPQEITVEDVMMPADDFSLQPHGPMNMSRRRSFTITSEGIKNHGDIIIQPPTSPSFVSIASQQQGPPSPEPPSPDPSTGSGEFVLTIPVPTLPPVSVGPPSPLQLRADSVDSVADSAEGMRIDSGCEDTHPAEEVPMISDDGEETWIDVPVYRVLALGGPGVGKTALTQQFMTSEYMAAQNTSFDDGIECCVPVLLDGEEYIMEFIDLPYTGNNIWKDYEVDAYLVVFSITDRRSFQKADDFVYEVRKEGHTSEAVVIVANKSDLVRSRLVAEEEARQLANNYDCKFIEVSAILNHKVDDLLVGLLKQIRLNYEAAHSGSPTWAGNEEKVWDGQRCSSICVDDSGCMTRTKEQVLGKFFKPRLSRSCENLLDL